MNHILTPRDEKSPPFPLFQRGVLKSPFIKGGFRRVWFFPVKPVPPIVSGLSLAGYPADVGFVWQNDKTWRRAWQSLSLTLTLTETSRLNAGRGCPTPEGPGRVPAGILAPAGPLRRLFRTGGGNIWYKRSFGKLPDGGIRAYKKSTLRPTPVP